MNESLPGYDAWKTRDPRDDEPEIEDEPLDVCEHGVGYDEDCDRCSEEAQEDQDDRDPTPWCTGCGAMAEADCHCGPLAEND